MTQAVLDGVRDLLPALRERADETERLRQVPDASVKELEETGFFRMLQPKRFDGLEGDPIDFFTAVSLIGSACGSTGWISSVLGVHPWQVALFHDDAQQAVWGDDTSTRLSSSYAPTGKATLADGGFTLEGRWSFSSGSAHATWVLLGGLVFNEEGQVVDFRTFMVPREKYEIVDVWNVVGLAGTGSNDIVVEETFIPEEFTLSMGDTGRCFGPGQEQNPGDLYKLPFHSLFTTTISSPIIGMAKRRVHRARRDAAGAGACGLRRREGDLRPLRRGAHRACVQRDRCGLGSDDGQHPRGAGAGGQGREDPAVAAAPGPS